MLWRTERDDALKFKKLLQAFEFVFNVLILVLLTEVLSSINAASIFLQSKYADLIAVHHLNNNYYSYYIITEYQNIIIIIISCASFEDLIR